MDEAAGIEKYIDADPVFTSKMSKAAREAEIARLSRRAAIRDAYTDLEHEMFQVGDDRRDEIAEVLKLTRAQMADDTASNDRQRFGGQRSLSFDKFNDDGWEPSPPDLPSYAVREEQEALEYGMKPFLDALTMDQGDAVRGIYRYSFSFRDGARRLGITTPALQRRVKRAIEALRKTLLEAAGFTEAEAA